jgi:hypothetical protein
MREVPSRTVEVLPKEYVCDIGAVDCATAKPDRDFECFFYIICFRKPHTRAW